ncbi:MAG: tetratricopeptide repeat protein [Pedobacter sp.]|nr:MAG: tetratricopeptide repeat protein [Pedobacter sp.]
MKKLLYLVLLATQMSFAQNTDNLLLFKKIEANVTKVSKSSKHVDLLKNFMNEYKSITKVDMFDLSRDLVGYGIYIDPKNNVTKLWPAKYTFNIKTALAAIGIINKAEPTEKQLEYLSVYTKNPSEIGKNEYVRELKYKDFEQENKLDVTNGITLKDNIYQTYFTKKDNWIYAISTNHTTDELILYKFDTKAIKSDDYLLIQMEKNRKVKWAEESKLRDVFPLYHDVRIDDIRTALYYLLREEPYKSDKKLAEYATNMRQKLDRTNIRKFTTELDYFLDLKIDEKAWKYKSDEVLNLKHTSAHALADIYFGEGNYKLAEKFFLRSLLDFKIVSAGGSNAQKDGNRIIYDLSKVYEKLGKTDEMLGYLIPLLNGNGSISSATELLNTYIEKNRIDKKTFRKQLDASFKTLDNVRNDGSFTYIFNGKVIFFYSVFNKTESSFMKEVTETDFYKSL